MTVRDYVNISSQLVESGNYLSDVLGGLDELLRENKHWSWRRKIYRALQVELLKLVEARTIQVEAATEMSDKVFKQAWEGRAVVVEKNEQLGAGIRVYDGDKRYDASLKAKLQNI